MVRLDAERKVVDGDKCRTLANIGKFDGVNDCWFVQP